MPKATYEIGVRYGRLVVTGEAPRKNGNRAVYCKCDCGEVRAVRLASLRAGATQSCGCFEQEARSTHKKTGTVEYRTWCDMLQRCYSPSASSYKNYGARGIRVADEWRNSFERFLEHVGPRPDGHSIERIDNEGNYEPGNVRWATQREQALNTRQNRLLTLGSRTQTIAEWAIELGIKRATLNYRLNNGWSVRQALLTPVERDHRRRHLVRPRVPRKR